MKPRPASFFTYSVFVLTSFLSAFLLSGCGRGNKDPVEAAGEAETALREGDYDKAARNFKITAESPEATKSTLYNLGASLDRAGKPEEAIGAFHKALALQPGDPDATEYLADLLHRNGDSRTAIQLLEPIVSKREAGPARARVLNAIATAEIDLGQTGPAVLRLLEAKRLAPSYAPTFYNLSKLYDKKFHLYPEAIEMMECYIKLADGNAPFLDEAKQQLKRLRAIPLPRRAPSSEPTAAVKELIARGNDFFARSRFTNAGNLYAEALDKDPGCYTAAVKLADARYRMKRYGEALAACRTAAEIDPDAMDPIITEANIAYMSGEDSHVIELLTTYAIPKWPSNPWWYQLVSYTLARSDRQAEVPPYAKAFVDVARLNGEDSSDFVKWVRTFLPDFLTQ